MKNVPHGSTIVWPAFKGVIKMEDPVGLNILQNPVDLSSKEIRQSFLKKYFWLTKTSPKLAQNIVRTVVASTIAPKKSIITAVEGSQHQLSDQKVTGADITKKIFNNVVPAEHKREINLQYFPKSNSTLEEVRTILNQILPNQKPRIIAVTNQYHKKRVHKILCEEYGKQGGTFSVITPTESLPLINNPFIKKIIELGAVSKKFNFKEKILEHLVYRPLHFISYWLEKMSGNKFNLEIWLAKKIRG